jgi:hypothetical protein
MMQSVDITPMTNIAIPFVQSASYPMRPGTSVRPLIDGEPAFRRICDHHPVTSSMDLCAMVERDDRGLPETEKGQGVERPFMRSLGCVGGI